MEYFDVPGLACRAEALKKKVLILLNSSWNVMNFRSNLIRQLLRDGYDVQVVSPQDAYSERIAALGCQYVPVPIDNKGTNPFVDFLFFIRCLKLFFSLKPDVLLSYTIKPNIYGSLAAGIFNLPVIHNIAGLGTTFSKKGWLNNVVRYLYRAALSRSAKVFFQNIDDHNLFVDEGLVSHKRIDLLPGSGVDLKRFTPVPAPNNLDVSFLLIARLLWEKGVGDFVQAAQILRQRGIKAEFSILGFLDVQNPHAITQQQMDEWVADGLVNYLGVSDNVSEHIAAADCIVLPSYYREGTPRALLEAAAMAKPLVTTDAVGCRETVEDGVNGFLCEPRNPEDLANKMQTFLQLSHDDRKLMGKRSREKVEREFDEKFVIDKYRQTIKDILQNHH